MQKNINTFPNPQTILVHSNYEIGFKYVKENVPRREFQESQENFSVTFKRKVTRIESHEDSKIKILREYEIAKSLKGGEVFLNNALNEFIKYASYKQSGMWKMRKRSVVRL